MLVTPDEAAELLGISKSTLYRWADDPTKGLAEHVRLGASPERLAAGGLQGLLKQVPLEAVARVILIGHRSDGYDRSAPVEPSAAAVEAKMLRLVPIVLVMRKVDRAMGQATTETAKGAANAVVKFRRRRRAKGAAA